MPDLDLTSPGQSRSNLIVKNERVYDSLSIISNRFGRLGYWGLVPQQQTGSYQGRGRYFPPGTPVSSTRKLIWPYLQGFPYYGPLKYA